MNTGTQTQAENSQDIRQACEELTRKAVAASHQMLRTLGGRRSAALERIARELSEAAEEIVSANKLDLAGAEAEGLSEAMRDRLKLDAKGVAKMAESVRQIAAQTDPVGQVIEGSVRPNGLRLTKVRVPLGVVLIIYESRPNVTCDAAALCIKSGNAVILRGGKEALNSNNAIANVVRRALKQEGLNPDCVQRVPTADRALVGELLKMEGRIDVVIPRGGESLIRAVVEQSRIPVIKHYTGNCHTYVDRFAAGLPAGQVVEVCVNAKTHRTGVCNATETFLFHAAATDLTRQVCAALATRKVELRCCARSLELLKGTLPAGQLKPADESDWHAEYLDLIAAVKVVDSLDDAVAHINKYGSRHTDAILTADAASADAFVATVDSANVMVNCSTRFSDGGEYGLGAEIGISTDKLHARGPMGAGDLTTYKWVVRGEGQVRG